MQLKTLQCSGCSQTLGGTKFSDQSGAELALQSRFSLPKPQKYLWFSSTISRDCGHGHRAEPAYLWDSFSDKYIFLETNVHLKQLQRRLKNQKCSVVLNLIFMLIICLSRTGRGGPKMQASRLKHFIQLINELDHDRNYREQQKGD